LETASLAAASTGGGRQKKWRPPPLNGRLFRILAAGPAAFQLCFYHNLGAKISKNAANKRLFGFNIDILKILTPI